MSRRNRVQSRQTGTDSNINSLEDENSSESSEVDTEESSPSLPGALVRPAQPADMVPRPGFEEAMKGRPRCSTCPSFVPSSSPDFENQCFLDPTPVIITDHVYHSCSHHPAFPEYVKNLTKNPIEFKTGLDMWDGLNCTCIKVGLVYHDPASTHTIQTKRGMTLVIRNSCPKCLGSGIIGGDFDKQEAGNQ